jgi:two-component system sensor histidine kinase YesM
MIASFKHRRIQSQLFISFSILIAGLIIILAIWLSVYFNLLIEYSASESVLQIAENVKTRIDSTIEKMDMAAKQVIFSDAITQKFLELPKNHGLLLELSSRRIISNNLHAIIGPLYSSVDQINLINCTNGNYIGAGLYPLETLISASEINKSVLISSTLTRNGLMNIIPPHTDQWSGNSGNAVFSVARSFKSVRDGNQQGIVEVPCSVAVLSDIFKNTIKNENVEKMFLFAQDGSTVYCSTNLENAAASYYEILNKNASAKASTLSMGDELLSYSISDYTGWMILLVAKKEKVVNPVTIFRSNILLFMVLSIPATLLLSYFISRRFTKPIKKIFTSINKLNLTAKGSEPFDLNTQQNELDQLYVSFQQLSKRLDYAIAETATARSYEMEAHMLALESRINPHFLYNTIAMIQAIAENEKCSDIAEICGEMSSLMRYSISKDNVEATIESEMYIASIYLDLMYRRYHDRLSYNIQMDPEIARLRVPRMILQPILENCFKHGFNTCENWKVNVTGYLEESSWYIKVSDNGSGIEENIISKLYDTFNSASTTHPIKSSTLEGVGLANIAIRMKLAFGDKACFEIINNENGGSTVIIGVKGGQEA